MYDIRNNYNYYVIKVAWKNRDNPVIRVRIREAIKWIRLDIAEEARWAKGN